MFRFYFLSFIAASRQFLLAHHWCMHWNSKHISDFAFTSFESINCWFNTIRLNMFKLSEATYFISSSICFYSWAYRRCLICWRNQYVSLIQHANTHLYSYPLINCILLIIIVRLFHYYCVTVLMKRNYAKILTSRPHALAGHQRAIGGNCHTRKSLPEAKLESKYMPRFYASGVFQAEGG